MIDDKGNTDTDSHYSTGSFTLDVSKVWSTAITDLELVLEELFSSSFQTDHVSDQKQLIDAAFHNIVLILIQFDHTSDEFYQYSDQVVFIFAQSVADSEVLSFGISTLLEILQKIASTNTWMTPTLCRAVLRLLFRIQFASGVRVELAAHCQRLSAASLCLDAMNSFLSAGRSLSGNAWKKLWEDLSEEVRGARKCSRSLLSFRLLYLQHLLAFLLHHHFITSHLVELLIDLFLLAQRIDDSSARAEGIGMGKVFLLPDYISTSGGGVIQPSNKSRASIGKGCSRMRAELFFGAGYWNDKVLNQHFTDNTDNHTDTATTNSPGQSMSSMSASDWNTSNMDKGEAAILPPHCNPSIPHSSLSTRTSTTRSLAQHFLAFNQRLLSCQHSLFLSLQQWLEGVWRELATAAQQRLQSALFESYSSHVEQVTASTMRERKKRQRQSEKQQKKKEKNKKKEKDKRDLVSPPSPRTPLSFPPLFLDINEGRAAPPPSSSSSSSSSLPPSLLSSEHYTDSVRVTSAYFHLFALCTSSFTSSTALSEIIAHLLLLLDQHLPALLSPQSEAERLRVFSLLQFLCCFLSHSPALPAFASDVTRTSVLRLLRWLTALLSADRADVSNDSSSSFLHYCIQSVFYVLLHRGDVTQRRGDHEERGAVEVEVEVEAESEEVWKSLTVLLADRRVRQSFSCAQWLYLRLFLLPSHAPSPTEVQREVVADVIRADSPLRREWEEEEESTASKESLVFALANPSPLPALLHRSTSSPHLLVRWWADSASPDPHSLTRSHLHLFLQHLRHLLIPTTKTSLTRAARIARRAGEGMGMGMGMGESLTSALSSELLLHIFSFLTFKRIVRLTQLSSQCRHLLRTSQSHLVFWREIYQRSFPKHRFLDPASPERKEVARERSKECLQCRALVRQLDKRKTVVQKEVAKEAARVKGRVCQSQSDKHHWFHLFQHQILTLAWARAKGRASAPARLCPIIGCNATFSSKTDESKHLSSHIPETEEKR